MTTSGPSISRFRRASRAALAALLLAGAAAVQAQTDAPPTGLNLPVATLDRDALFLGSKFGLRVQAALESDRNALEAENRRIEAGLIDEEQALTAERPSLSPAEFTAKADAFDEKVQGIRQRQDQKALDLQRHLEQERQAFLSAIIPVLNELLARHGTAVLLDRNSVIFAAQSVDITEDAIALIDERIGDGASPELTAPGTAQEPAAE